VHFLNSANLLDRLTFAGVRGFRFRMFTDSDHSISTRHAYAELHAEMTSASWLQLLARSGCASTRAAA